MTRLPDFFLAGAPKAGTTALYQYLGQHPAIYMSPVKEPNFFASEIRMGSFSSHFRKLTEAHHRGPVTTWTEYEALFRNAGNETALGEASVSYLWSESAPRNIAEKLPDAKILAVLRNPIDRALSQYAHMLSFAETPVTFTEYLDAAMHSTNTEIGEYYPFLHFGFYYRQLKRYRAFFNPGRIQIHFYEDFLHDPKQILRKIFRFLDVDPDFEPDLSLRHMESAIPRSYFLKNVLDRLGIREALRGRLPPEVRRYVRTATLRSREGLAMTPDDRIRLIDFYREDIGSLAELLGRDLTSWLDHPGRAAYQRDARTGRR